MVKMVSSLSVGDVALFKAGSIHSRGEVFHIYRDEHIVDYSFLGERNGSWGCQADKFVQTHRHPEREDESFQALTKLPMYKLLQHNYCRFSTIHQNTQFELFEEKW